MRRDLTAPTLLGTAALLLSACSMRATYASGSLIDRLSPPEAVEQPPGVTPLAPPPTRLERVYEEYRFGAYTGFADGGGFTTKWLGDRRRFESDQAGRTRVNNVFENGYDDARDLDLTAATDTPARRQNPAEQRTGHGEGFIRLVRKEGSDEVIGTLWGVRGTSWISTPLPPWVRFGYDWGLDFDQEDEVAYFDVPLAAHVSLYPEEALGFGIQAGAGISPLSALSPDMPDDRALLNYGLKAEWGWGWKLFALGAAVEHRRTNYAMPGNDAGPWLSRNETSAMLYGQFHMDLISPR